MFPRSLEPRYREALQAELRAHVWQWTPKTVYLGGGTPSQMDPADLAELLALIPGGPWSEATLETAPGTITMEKARAWAAAGINRVSLGAQSFVDAEIRRTGRKHTAQTIAEDVRTLAAAGIANYNIDLIAGLAAQTESSWGESLDWIARLDPPHVSIYMLEIDDDSRLGHELRLGGVRYFANETPSEDQTAGFYEIAVERLAALGIARYEISNFARPGFESRHNLKYWKLERYAGFGADAHSFDGSTRTQNPESVADYVDRRAPESTPANTQEERFFVGLRLMRGIRPEPDEWARFDQPIRRFADAGLLESEDGVLRLTPRGVMLSNEIFQEFLNCMIDLRSDTVTKPTPAMRRAMMEAEVGDDVYGEDPTVNRLEQRAAEIAGKEAALFVPTGTMGNAIAIKLHTEHGQEVISEARSHILDWELGMVAWFSGCVVRAIPTENGILSWPQIRGYMKAPSAFWAPTALVAIENTHNMLGGNIYSLEAIREIAEGAHERGVKVHMDGARVFNASAATGVPVSDIVAPVDTVMFCLSKGLGAPAGSILAGPAELIAKGRLYRKRLGGGMRQVGVLAAACLIAMEESPKLLPCDHANARFLAEGLARIPGIQIAPESVATNIAVFDVSATGIAPTEISARLKRRGVLMNAINDRQMRAVTHYDVDRPACSQALETVAECLAK